MSLILHGSALPNFLQFWMQKKIGVILLNLGGPETLEDVAPFLYNLFSDREIIRLGPVWLQKPLAWLVARTRAPKSRKTYARIGGGSPLVHITLQQAQALQETLRSEGNFRVVTAMRYWQPRVTVALEKLAEEGISEIVALPLYPHYSCATTGSSFSDLKTAMAASDSRFRLQEITSWADHPSYISCLCEHIRRGLAVFSGEMVQIVYSAHSLPAAFIDQGDPYLEHLQKTIQGIEAETGREGLLCFQSRSGPVRWLSPSTPETIERLAQSGCKNILMVPISFVSDHVETLYEIDILYKQMARDLGMRLESSTSLNTDPAFIKCLKDIILERLESIENPV
jgi:protoporphyrin/coproporphyrin ferrochelatase